MSAKREAIGVLVFFVSLAAILIMLAIAIPPGWLYIIPVGGMTIGFVLTRPRNAVSYLTSKSGKAVELCRP